jgi:hypothetical protein
VLTQHFIVDSCHMLHQLPHTAHFKPTQLAPRHQQVFTPLTQPP